MPLHVQPIRGGFAVYLSQDHYNPAYYLDNCIATATTASQALAQAELLLAAGWTPPPHPKRKVKKLNDKHG